VETAVAVGSLAITAFLFAIERRASAVQAARERFGAALGDVQRWMELPYRVRRRASGDEARYALAAEVSSLQERLAFHSAWLQVEGKEVSAAYDALLKAARGQVRTHIRDAWSAEPISEDSGMNLQDFEVPVDVVTETDAYLQAVRKHTAVWSIWRWR